MSVWSTIRRVLDWRVIDAPTNRFLRPLWLSCDRLNRKLYPELARLEDAEERVKAHEAAWDTADKSNPWLFELYFAVSFLSLLVLPVLDAYGGLSHLRPTSQALIGTCVLAPPVVMTILLVWGFHRKFRRALRRECARRGVPICVECAYDLTGNVSGRCPECGHVVVSSEQADSHDSDTSSR